MGDKWEKVPPYREIEGRLVVARYGSEGAEMERLGLLSLLRGSRLTLPLTESRAVPMLVREEWPAAK